MATKKPKPKEMSVGLILLIYVAFGLFVAWIIPAGREFLTRWRWAVILAILVLLGALVVPPIRRWLAKATASRRAGMIVFVVIPLLLVLVGIIVVLPSQYQTTVVRSVFFLVVCLFPAAMYYLFIATSKYSLLYEFLTNLDRLGLLTHRQWPLSPSPDVEIMRGLESDRQRRVLTYLRKFEAVYGPLPDNSLKQILEATAPPSTSTDPHWDQIVSSGFTTTFTQETTVPLVLATVLIALGWLITLPPWLAKAPEWPASLIPQQTPVHFAFLGAYFFSLQLLFRRYVRWDLDASAYVAIALRIILAVIGTWVVVQAVVVLFPQQDQQTWLSVLGFAIGVFPPVVWQFVQAVIKKATGATVLLPSLQSQMPLSDLDGFTVWHEARLEEEDIENIPNMATADLVELMLNTRFSPDRIIDWVDQAILYTHLGPEQKKNLATSPRARLRTHGIRTATSLTEAYQKSKAYGDPDTFEKILSGEGRSPIRSLVDTVATNPNLELIRTWRGLAEAAAQRTAQPDP